MIFDLLHLIFGYIFVRADGGFIERFINLCTSQGIPLWDIKKHGDYLTARTSISGFMKIRNPAKQSGMKIKVIKKSGLPFVIKKYKKRIGFGVGILIFSLGLFMLSGRAWIIDVTGNSKVSCSEITEAFENAGLKIGCKISKIDANKVRINALNQLTEISWVTINARGCKIVIEVREAVNTPSIEKRSGTSNIVATKDGQIEIIEPYKGVAKVKPGQTVLKGALLISGIRENRLQENLYDDSFGYAVARTTTVIESTAKFNQLQYKIKRKNFYSAYFLGIEYPFTPKTKAKILYNNLSCADIKNVVLPFGIKTTSFTNLGKKETAGKDFTLLAAMEEYALKSYNQTVHAQIISKDVEIIEADNSITIKGTYSCFENICQRVEYDVEEIYSEEQ